MVAALLPERTALVGRVARGEPRELVGKRARIDTRVLEVIARFEGAPGAPLPLGLRMYLHVDR